VDSHLIKEQFSGHFLGSSLPAQAFAVLSYLGGLMFSEPVSRCIVSNHQGLPFSKEVIVRLLLHWILSALAVWIVAHVVPGISVSGPVAA
jgi:hypothetical protein